MVPFNVISATNPGPLLISVPHCGIQFPAELRDQYDPALISAPDDTDWFVDHLYDFAPAMGFSMITAVYNRWVIDLNRDPESKPLYHDGRIITGLCPVSTFLGEPLYVDQRQEIDHQDVEDRLTKFYWPYHHQIQSMLAELKSKHGRVLLWDCHSIRRSVATIQAEPFPDLILGSADEKAAAPQLVQTALKHLGSSSYDLTHNHPFKGGYITRTYGKPQRNQHALQLEMAKINYMNDLEVEYHAGRAERMRELLKKTLGALAEALMKV